MILNCQSGTQADETESCRAGHEAATRFICREGHSENAPHRLEAEAERRWRDGEDNKSLPVVMRLRDTPVPIPNTKVKT